MASPFAPPRFVTDEKELTSVLVNLKLRPCPHCRQSGALIGHGFLRGYAESSSEREVRGRRFFCSNRALRRGCGRTFSVMLMTVLSGFIVRTTTLFRFATSVLSGLSRRAAWLAETNGAFSMSTGYRLWRRLSAAQSELRVRLSSEGPAPTSDAREPLAQLLSHFRAVLPSAAESDCFAAFQAHMQRELLNAQQA